MADQPSLAGDLCRACESITTGLDYDEVLDTIVTQAVRCLDAKAAAIRLLDRSARVLDLAAAHGFSPGYLAKGPIEVDRSPLDREALEGRVVRIRDVTTDPRFQYPREAEAEGLRSLLCVPLKHRRRTLGVLRVYTAGVRDFSTEDEAFTLVLAAQSAAALANALRFRRMKSLNAIGRTIVSRLDVAGVLNLICESAVDSLSAGSAVLYLRSAESGRLESVSACGPGSGLAAAVPPEEDPAMAPCLEGLDVVIEGGEARRGEGPPAGPPAGPARSLLCVPVRRGDRVLGVLRAELAYPYVREEEDLEFLHTLADFGIVALENARLHEHLKRDYEDLTRDVWKWYDWGERKPLL